ncbi:MAG TPA: endo-1,4-beta-xylanase [Gemmatimonadaceae bacterium]|nr:endo-1,4-beta-xylanase [Gemmatimonadaceae bacterium]
MRRALVAASITLNACHAATPAPSAVTLKDAFAGSFVVGAAVNGRQIAGADSIGDPIIARQFNSITPENVLKWASVEPLPGQFEFAAPDRYVALGERHGMTIIGHTLVWHNQTPAWVFQNARGGPVSRDTLIARMRSHVLTVVGRYRGRIHGWDVVNEAVNEDGSLRQSPWMRIIGPEYIAMAFRFAHEADPSAELHYNDFSVEGTAKRAGIVRLVESLRAEGVPITAIGMQEHQKLDWPTTGAIDSAIVDLAKTGLKLMVTELDVDVLPSNRGQRTESIEQQLMRTGAPDPYRAGLPDSVERALAKRYGEIMRVYLAHRGAITRVTFWGVDDADTWLNGFPVRGRVNYPLLFDRHGVPKPAFDSVIAAARTAGRVNASH